MMVKISSDLCFGCGVCIETCPVGAIHLVDDVAVIDDELCSQCEACVDACPNGAITLISVPLPSPPAMTLAKTQTGITPISTKTSSPEVLHPNRSLAPVAGAALAFLGSEIAPRILDLLIATLERRLAQPEMTGKAPFSSPSRSITRRNEGTRKQIRYRGGRTVIGNLKERR
jgi:NAD-dependent dihydropyrimidine dehydrogenase PreA subunit